MVCQSSLRHQNTAPDGAFSQVTCPSLAVFAASRCSSPTLQKGCPARRQASSLNPDLYLTLRPKEAADVRLGSLRGKSPSHSPEPQFKRPEDLGLGRGGACCVEGSLARADSPSMPPPPAAEPQSAVGGEGAGSPAAGGRFNHQDSNRFSGAQRETSQHPCTLPSPSLLHSGEGKLSPS